MNDFDDLLEDLDDGKTQAKPKKTTKVNIPKKKEEDDMWGDLADINDAKAASVFGKDSGGDLKSGGRRDTQTTFGYGGAHGLRKETKKKDDDDDEWGIDLAPSKSGGGSRLLGRKSLPKDDDDELDNILDVVEASRGIESTKIPSPKQEKRPKTAGIPKANNQWGEVFEKLDDVDDRSKSGS